MLFYFHQFLGLWLTPPGIIIIFLAFGIVLSYRRIMIARCFILLGLMSLWLLSTPLIAQPLTNYLQYKFPPLSSDPIGSRQNSAIVVLEASLNPSTPEYGKITVSETTLVRLRYAAYLYKKLGVPILVSGNDPSHLDINQADYMADALKSYFDTPTAWKESQGFNTAEEGIRSTEILKQAGIKRIYLVTHAIHIPRSVQAFRNHGIEIIPAPTGYKSFEFPLGYLSYLLPNMDSLNASVSALHEYIGMAWYKIYYDL